MLAAIDIETSCNVEYCPKDSGCRHALDFNRNKIDVIALAQGDGQEFVFRGPKMIDDLRRHLELNPDLKVTGHEAKFDIKNLLAKGLDLRSMWAADSCQAAFVLTEKIPDDWLLQYEEKRQHLNKTRVKQHREAGAHSLKTLAPYFLGVDAFWEPDGAYDNDEYVLKDARYALRLTKILEQKLKDSGQYEFYKTKQLEWAKLLLDMEFDGVRLDEEKCKKMWQETEIKAKTIKYSLGNEFKPQVEKWAELQKSKLFSKYEMMTQQALLKPSKKVKDEEKVRAKYNKLRSGAESKIAELNIDSPDQLLWLLKEIGLNPRNWEGKESTDKEALNRLANSDSRVRGILEYRQAKKLCSTYFPEWLNYSFNGRIHASFNSTNTRTGRLSCSDPNLQQVPAALKQLIIADNNFIVRDLSAIEPTVLAYFSEDQQLCELLLNNGDFHGTNAVQMFNLKINPNEVKSLEPKLRQIAKKIGLSILYGAGGRRVKKELDAEGLGHYTEEQAKGIVYRLRDHYRGVWKFKQEIDSVLEKGETIYNLLGRPIKINNPEDVYMKGLNRLIQSSASDILLDSAKRIKCSLLKPRLMIHDELVVDNAGGDDAVDFIEKEMTSFPLQTQWGMLKIKVEGAEGRAWKT